MTPEYLASVGTPRTPRSRVPVDEDADDEERDVAHQEGRTPPTSHRRKTRSDRQADNTYERGGASDSDSEDDGEGDIAHEGIQHGEITLPPVKKSRKTRSDKGKKKSAGSAGQSIKVSLASKKRKLVDALDELRNNEQEIKASTRFLKDYAEHNKIPTLKKITTLLSKDLPKLLMKDPTNDKTWDDFTYDGDPEEELDQINSPDKLPIKYKKHPILHQVASLMRAYADSLDASSNPKIDELKKDYEEKLKEWNNWRAERDRRETEDLLISDDLFA